MTTTTAKIATVASTTMATNVRMNKKLTALEKKIIALDLFYTLIYF